MNSRTGAAFALLLASTAIAASPALAPSAFADVLVDNVDGVTADGKGGVERFEGFLIDGEGRIAEVYRHGDKRPKKVDYQVDGKGRAVVPGMIDGHGHVMGTGFAKMTLDLSMAKTLDEALSRIAAWAAAHPDAPWILGSGWNQVQWGLDRMPTAAELDGATGGKPAWLTRVDGHAGWANSAAIAAAGITATTANPPGGEILRTAGAKQPSGVFVDGAMALVEAKMPRPRPEDRDTALGEAQLALLAQGVTTIADMGTSIEDWQSMRRAADAGRLRIRIVTYADGIDNMMLIGGPRPTPWLYDDHLKMNGVKLYLDGALGSRGAWLKQPYADAPGTRGLPRMNETQLSNLMSRAAMDNFQVAVHAIGDAANGEILDAIQEMSDTYSGDRRWRVEHAQIIDPADLPRFARYGTIASMQPVHETSDWRMATARLGEARLKGAYAWKAMLDNKVPLAFGSDVPVESPNPFPGIAAAMSRQDARGEPAGGWMPEQKVSFEAALDGFTRQAAFAGFAEKKFGSLVPGQRADFLLIDRNIETASPTDIRGTQVLETWINGKRVYVKGQ